MFTDVVGYTALTERDEGAAVKVRDHHRSLVGTLVEQFDGQVIDVAGDESAPIYVELVQPKKPGALTNFELVGNE